MMRSAALVGAVLATMLLTGPATARGAQVDCNDPQLRLALSYARQALATYRSLPVAVQQKMDQAMRQAYGYTMPQLTQLYEDCGGGGEAPTAKPTLRPATAAPTAQTAGPAAPQPARPAAPPAAQPAAPQPARICFLNGRAQPCPPRASMRGRAIYPRRLEGPSVARSCWESVICMPWQKPPIPWGVWPPLGAPWTYEQVGTRETGDPALNIPFTPIGLESNPKPAFPPGGGSIISGEGGIAFGAPAGITTGPPDTPPPPTQKWLRPGDTLITTGEAFIRMEDGTLGWLAPGSQLMVLETSTDGAQVRLDFGRIAANVRSGTQFRISTPGGMVIDVYGTEFLAAVDEDGTLTVNVTEGIVSVRSAGEYVILSPGESVAVLPGEPPPDPVDLSPDLFSVIGQVIAHFAMPDEPLPDAASLSAAFGTAIPWVIAFVVVVLLITVVTSKNQQAAGWQRGKYVSGLQRGKQGTKILFRVRDGQFEVRLAWRTTSDLIPLWEITSAEITDLTGIGLLGRGWTRTQDRFLVMHYAPGNVIAAITVTARLPALETAQREITAFLAVHPRLDELRSHEGIS